MGDGTGQSTETIDRWWALIAGAFPDSDRLRAALTALSRDELLSFGVHVYESRLTIRGPWDGPDIPGIGPLSEDSTEDLTDFIVGQGEAAWEEASEADDAGLAVWFERSVAARKGGPGSWQPDADTHLMGLTYRVWSERFDPDTFHDELHAAMDELHG